MKVLLIGLLVIGSVSAFAKVETVDCEELAYRQIVASKIVEAKMNALVRDIETGDNMEKVLDISEKARELANLACNK